MVLITRNERVTSTNNRVDTTIPNVDGAAVLETWQFKVCILIFCLGEFFLGGGLGVTQAGGCLQKSGYRDVFGEGAKKERLGLSHGYRHVVTVQAVFGASNRSCLFDFCFEDTAYLCHESVVCFLFRSRRLPLPTPPFWYSRRVASLFHRFCFIWSSCVFANNGIW